MPLSAPDTDLEIYFDTLIVPSLHCEGTLHPQQISGHGSEDILWYVIFPHEEEHHRGIGVAVRCDGRVGHLRRVTECGLCGVDLTPDEFIRVLERAN